MRHDTTPAGGRDSTANKTCLAREKPPRPQKCGTKEAYNCDPENVERREDGGRGPISCEAIVSGRGEGPCGCHDPRRNARVI